MSGGDEAARLGVEVALRQTCAPAVSAKRPGYGQVHLIRYLVVEPFAVVDRLALGCRLWLGLRGLLRFVKLKLAEDQFPAANALLALALIDEMKLNLPPWGEQGKR